ncbi:MAG: hypothetical protein ACREOW_07600 [Thermodesulfobacteriota bacterium]
MADLTISTKFDWFLNSSRAKPLVAQPDRFYIKFIYNTLHNHLYHTDVDSVIVDKDQNIVCILETIKGIGREITPFKKAVLSRIAEALGVSFCIVNWDKDRGVVVIDVFRETTKSQTWLEHGKWLRNLRGLQRIKA